MLLTRFQSIGQSLFARGLICNRSGNLSTRDGDRLWITLRGSALDCLEEKDIVCTGIYEDDQFTPKASSELAVHRAIYKKTRAAAVVHAHPTHVIALSFTGKEIVPCEMEGQLILGRVPAIGKDTDSVKPGALAEEIAGAFKGNNIVVVRAHGSFAIGQSLDEALGYTVTLEHCCHILYLVKTLGINHSKVSG